MTLHAIGSEVHIAPEHQHGWPAAGLVPHSTFIVEQLPVGRRATYVLAHRDAGRVKIKARPDQVVAGPHPTFAGVEVVPVPPVLENGTVVEHKTLPGLWVITGFTGKGHQMFPLGGGAAGRRNVSGLSLTVVTLDLA